MNMVDSHQQIIVLVEDRADSEGDDDDSNHDDTSDAGPEE